MLTEEALQVIRRMMSKDELCAIWPDQGVPITAWCRYQYAKKEYLNFCTRVKGHDGPHIDYHVYRLMEKAPTYLIWEVTKDE